MLLPFSPTSWVCNIIIKMEAQEKAESRQAQLQFQLEIRRLEIEADTAVRLRQLELESRQREAPAPSATAIAEKSTPSTSSPLENFEIGKHINLVPPFRETEVDCYFAAFERIASALQWPVEMWPLLLQCRLSGKAQEAVATLSLEDSLN